MDPQQKFEGFSYEDVVVRPAADALRTVSRPSTKVGGSMQLYNCTAFCMLWSVISICYEGTVIS